MDLLAYVLMEVKGLIQFKQERVIVFQFFLKTYYFLVVLDEYSCTM